MRIVSMLKTGTRRCMLRVKRSGICQPKVASAREQADHANAFVVNTPRSEKLLAIQTHSKAFSATLNEIHDINLMENHSNEAAGAGKPDMIMATATAE